MPGERRCPVCGDEFCRAPDAIYCSKKCKNVADARATKKKRRAGCLPRLQDFLQKTCPEPNTGCLLWTKCMDDKGYGQTSYGSAHRISYKLHVGEIPDGMHVCHKCDTPACVNPEHLFLGTHDDNMLDKAKKQRIVNAKLTASDAAYIFFERKSIDAQDLAKEYGVSDQTIRDIRLGRSWSHVTGCGRLHRPQYTRPPQTKKARNH